MKMNWKVLKSPKFIIGAIVLFFVVLYLLNKSSASSTGVVTAAATPATDDTLALAQLAAAGQNDSLAASLQANSDNNATQIALATIGEQASNYQTGAAAQIAALGISEQSHEADLAAQISALGIGAQTQAAQLQYQTNLATITAAQNTAAMAYSSANYAIANNTQLQEYLSGQQLQMYQISTAAQLVSSLAGRNTYSSIALPQYFANQPVINNNNAPSLIAPPTYNYGSLA